MGGELLVAVDGSEHSERIADEAATIAKRSGAKIVLLYVTAEIDIPEAYREYAKVEKIDPSEYYSGLSKKILADIGRQIEKEGVQWEGVSEFGSAAKRIVEVARTRGVDMIVMGHHGLHGIGQLKALGSTARRVIDNSTVPVIVVP